MILTTEMDEENINLSSDLRIYEDRKTKYPEKVKFNKNFDNILQSKYLTKNQIFSFEGTYLHNVSKDVLSSESKSGSSDQAESYSAIITS